MMAGRTIFLLSLAMMLPVMQPQARATETAAGPVVVLVQAAAAEGERELATPTEEPASGAPYMRPLARLSSILGSVHFLRRLCGDEDAEVWRDKMSEILATLAPNPADRQILTAAFNDGFRAFESTYRNCTPAARVALARYQGEGSTLSREISARYGN